MSAASEKLADDTSNVIFRDRRGIGRHPISARVVADLVRLGDGLLLLAAAVVAWWVADSPASGPGPFAVAGAIGIARALVTFSRADVYSLPTLLNPSRAAAPRAWGLLMGAGLAMAALLLADIDGASAVGWAAGWTACGGTSGLLARLGVTSLLRRLRRQGRLARKVAIVGLTQSGAALLGRIGNAPSNLAIVGLYADDGDSTSVSPCGVPVLGGLDDLIADARLQPIDTVVVALPLAEQARVGRICDRLRDVACDIYLATDIVGLHYAADALAEFDGHPVIVERRRPLGDWQGVQKRAFDLVLGCVFLVLLVPVMAAIALAIRLDSPGPVLFRQRRLGFNNTVFTVLKFRTMFHHLADPLAARATARNDPRVTRVGRWLRRLSLDELPQIFNVLRGDMSLVGPRPHVPNSKAANRPFADVVAGYAHRHVVRPGITGWAQVNGWRGETSTEEQIRQRVAHDLYYIENWSVLFDAKILWLTFRREIFSQHAY